MADGWRAPPGQATGPARSARPARPTSLGFAAVLLAVVGVSGLAVGIQLLSVAAGTISGFAIAVGVGIYGLACFVSAVGLFFLRRGGWWLGLAAIVVGLGVLVWIQLIFIAADLDPVIGFGLVVWGVTLALLLVPGTGAAVRA